MNLSNSDEPYRDDPFSSSSTSNPQPEPELDNSELLQSQNQIFEQQDSHLDTLSLSIGRQRDLSIQMNDELELQAGLLDELDGDVENTGLRLGRASSRLRRVERSLKEHGEFSSSVVRLELTLLASRGSLKCRNVSSLTPSSFCLLYFRLDLDYFPTHHHFGHLDFNL